MSVFDAAVGETKIRELDHGGRPCLAPHRGVWVDISGGQYGLFVHLGVGHLLPGLTGLRVLVVVLICADKLNMDAE